jgi:RNA polymerase sigma-70 factor (ECF subfamily)
MGLGALSVEQRAVLDRCFYRGWTTYRTAVDLGITDCAVKSTLHDALRVLLAYQSPRRGST